MDRSSGGTKQRAQATSQSRQPGRAPPFVLELIVFAKAMIMPDDVHGLRRRGLCSARLIYYTVKREETFAKEFEKRANSFSGPTTTSARAPSSSSARRLLEKTYYEMFEMRAIMKRRKLDHIMEPSDRIFLVQQGTAYLVRDTLKELKFVKYDGNPPAARSRSSKSIFANNPCFTRVFGILPVGPFNDFLNIIPGLFIVGGIFGTFLGIMQALPELGAMDIRDPESTKLVMDTFLAKIAFSMSTSTVGIMLSVMTTVYNNFLSPERLFIKIVDRFERNLFRLWSRCDNNSFPSRSPISTSTAIRSKRSRRMSIEKGIASGSKRVNDAREKDAAPAKPVRGGPPAKAIPAMPPALTQPANTTPPAPPALPASDKLKDEDEVA